jgi:hypothetical protein
VRKIICKYQKGKLTPSEFGIHYHRPSPSEKRRGWFLVGFLGFLLFAFVWATTTFQSF